MLELRDIEIEAGRRAWHGLSLDVREGEYFVVLGPSGAGKTVLLEVISGLRRPKGGTICWKGRDITTTMPEKRRFAVVYQDMSLFPHLTVRDNIAYGLKWRPLPTDSRESRRNWRGRRVGELAELVGVSGLLDRWPLTLSGGEQQRVALARALAAEAEMLLLDEPLSALDMPTRRQLRHTLKEVNQRLHLPVIHVTHSPEEAMSLADRIAVMFNDRIRQVAPPEQLFRRPSDPAVAAFLGIWNVLAVTERRGELCRAAGVEIYLPPDHASQPSDGSLNAADETFTHVWVRPEEILLSRKEIESSGRNSFACDVQDWEPHGALLLVRVNRGALELRALITHRSFELLGIAAKGQVFATFKTSAIHCF